MLDAQHQLRPETDDALRRAVRLGIDVVPATSRPPGGITHLFADSPKFAVTLNGACVFGAGNRRWESEGLPSELIEDLLLSQHSHDVVTNFYSSTSWWSSNPMSERVTEEADRTNMTPCILEYGSQTGPTLKALLLGPPEKLDLIEVDLETWSHSAAWFRSEPSYLEIVPRFVSKGHGVRTVESWSKAGRTLAIGDAVADLAMFAVVDVAVAVENAPARVRGAADVVMPSNDQLGLARLLSLLCAGEPPTNVFAPLC